MKSRFLILETLATLEENRVGFLRLPGTSLKNEQTGETVDEPPQNPDTILALMANLEQFINDDDLCDWDPLTEMALIHISSRASTLSTMAMAAAVASSTSSAW